MSADEKTSSPAIEISGLSFSYDAVPVLEQVELVVPAGDFVCMVGPNGGGKTTLLKLLAGLLRPTAGSVRVFGLDPFREKSAGIGYMPQRAYVDPEFPVDVTDVVTMGRLGRGGALGFYGREDREAAIQAMRQVGLYEVRRRHFAGLSGGQQQRAFLARALASRPRLLLLDEPTSNLDLLVEEDLFQLLADLNRETTIVMVSHDLGFVTRLVRRIVCVNRRVFVHPSSEITGEILSEVYGGEIRMIRHDHILNGREAG
ncbi:ABC transporter ATP-binding protein [Candidatus Sumerlaeota bacterium]|nr:ABC transporter ATP-binding protein [Candidatus Sumerlaeota bacterium]